MKQLVKKHKIKLQYASPFVFLGVLSFAVFGFGGNQAFIEDLEPFVLVAENSIHLAGDIQISSGNIASNKNIQIAEKGIINGGLFSDRIQLAESVSINGDTTSNRLNKAETAEILGEITNSVQQNIVELPTVPNFQTGNADKKITENVTLNPGSYNDVEVKEGVTLTLAPGIYNLNSLVLKDSSQLVYSGPTTVNVKTSLRIQNDTLIYSNNPQSTSATELQINYAGKKPANIGDNSSITAKVLAPTSRVQIGNRATFRGQIFAGDIHLGEGGTLSRKLSFVKESDLTNIAEDSEAKFILNEIVILLDDSATQSDAQRIAELVDGKITGFTTIPKIYKIEVSVQTVEELNSKVQILREADNPLIIQVIRNFIGN